MQYSSFVHVPFETSVNLKKKNAPL